VGSVEGNPQQAGALGKRAKHAINASQGTRRFAGSPDPSLR
jgi:hypothetical protein